MILGIGTDITEVTRFESWADGPKSRLLKIFSLSELAQCMAPGGGYLPEKLAARFAAKEALAKALGAPMGLKWHDAEVIKSLGGAPSFVLRDSVAQVVNGAKVHLSMSHDAGIASALVMVERE